MAEQAVRQQPGAPSRTATLATPPAAGPRQLDTEQRPEPMVVRWRLAGAAVAWLQQRSRGGPEGKIDHA